MDNSAGIRSVIKFSHHAVEGFFPSSKKLRRHFNCTEDKWFLMI